MFEEAGAPWVRMEEEEEGGTPPSRHFGFGPPAAEQAEDDERVHVREHAQFPAGLQEFLRSLAEERKAIHTNEKLTAKQKGMLLEENRKTLVVATGGNIRKTENVAYGLLIFGGIILVILALLTTFAKLPSEVTLSFVGTVLGGTIATISQKLGKI